MPKVNRPKTAVTSCPGAPPPTRKGALRRQALLDAARAVFMEQGYAAASIDQVVERVGGSKASVYQYFGSKEGLFGEMIAAQCEEFLKSIAFPTVVEGDIEQTLLNLARRATELFLRPERIALHRAVIAEAARFPELAQRFYEAGPKRGLAQLGAFLKSQHEAGVLNCPNPELAAIHLMDLVRAFPIFRSLLGLTPMPSGQTLDDFIQDAVHTFLYGCLRRR